MSLNWIKCSDRLPEDGQRVMYYFAEFKSVWMGRFFKHGETGLPIWVNCDMRGFLGGGEVTHWAEIPEGPKDDENT